MRWEQQGARHLKKRVSVLCTDVIRRSEKPHCGIQKKNQTVIIGHLACWAGMFGY